MKRKMIKTLQKGTDFLSKESYDRISFKEKPDNVFELIVDFSSNGRKWVNAS